MMPMERVKTPSVKSSATSCLLRTSFATAVSGRIETPMPTSIERLIVSMLSNSITRLTSTLRGLSMRSIVLRVGMSRSKAARQLMFGVANDNELVVAKRNDGEVRPPERQRDNAEIDRVVETGLIDLVGATVFDVYFYLRVSLDEPFDVGRQLVQADAVNGGHLDRAGDRGRFGPHPLFQRADPFENLFAFGVKDSPGLGGRHAL